MEEPDAEGLDGRAFRVNAAVVGTGPLSLVISHDPGGLGPVASRSGLVYGGWLSGLRRSRPSPASFRRTIQGAHRAEVAALLEQGGVQAVGRGIHQALPLGNHRTLDLTSALTRPPRAFRAPLSRWRFQRCSGARSTAPRDAAARQSLPPHNDRLPPGSRAYTGPWELRGQA